MEFNQFYFNKCQVYFNKKLISVKLYLFAILWFGDWRSVALVRVLMRSGRPARPRWRDFSPGRRPNVRHFAVHQFEAWLGGAFPASP